MKFNIISISLIGFLLLICNCRSQNRDVSINLCGTWAYLNQSDSYSEFYFSDQILTIYSDREGIMGPYNYKINGDSLYYSDCQYAIIFHSCDSLCLFSTFFGKVELEKIKMVNQKEELNSYNPFYLRRCFYLVNRGKMKMSDAIDYLNSIWPVESIQEELIYSSPRK